MYHLAFHVCVRSCVCVSGEVGVFLLIPRTARIVALKDSLLLELKRVCLARARLRFLQSLVFRITLRQAPRLPPPSSCFAFTVVVRVCLYLFLT